MSEKSAANAGKEVLYIDVEDEITAIIDKVHSSKQKIVALVLPKRATVFQSIVNMKLLKRSADSAHKNLVLITSETGLLPLAGTVGIHVARSLQSKPEVPDAPGHPADDAEAIDEDEAESLAAADGAVSAAAAKAKKNEDKLDKTRTVGELAGAAAVDDELDDDNIDLDNDEEPAAAGPLAALKQRKGSNKKLKVPNFNKFRLLLILGGVGVVALIVLLYVGLAVMPKATIAVKTDSSAVNGSGAIILNTADGTALDTESGVMPATEESVEKTASQQVAATGEQNNGERAGGTMKLTNCTSSPATIPAGTGVSAGGLTFITQETASLSDGNFTSGGSCKSTGSHVATVAVVAQQAGAKYNVAARSDYVVAGHSGVSGAGSAMKGGTDEITKIVTQGDIDNAKGKLNSADTDSIKQELKTALIAKSLFAVEVSFKNQDPQVKTSVNAGDAAENVTVTQTTKYTMLGIKSSDFEKVIAANVKSKIDKDTQKILDYGLDNISLDSQSQDGSTTTVSYQTTVVVGSELDVEAIKKQIAGKKAGDAVRIIKQNTGVTEVDVNYSPFWVSSIPKKTSKITIDVEKPTVSSSSRNADNP